MYAVREEVEVLKEQIKELYERNSVLERENAVLKSLANTQQLSQLSSQLSCLSPPLQLHQPPFIKNSAHSLVHHEGSQGETVAGGFTSSVSLSCAGRQCWRQGSCEKTSDPNCPPSIHIATSLQGWRRKRRPDCRHGAGRNERRKKKSSLSRGGQDRLSLLD
ncbi:hypothetical protein XENOCAPTIV_007606 [Xenoophorus captivus]|uniref:Uncharacterized protein n=1 Tax=Xenoophorus captivus TaxID=1517983 RepID=A0ABV0SB58_9TELE